MTNSSDHNTESPGAKGVLYEAAIPHVHNRYLKYLEIRVQKKQGGDPNLSEDDGKKLVDKMNSGDPVQYIKFYDDLKAKYDLEEVEWGIKDSTVADSPGYGSYLVLAGIALNRVKSGLGTAIFLGPLSTLTNMILSGAHTVASAIFGGIICTTAFAFAGPIGIVAGAAAAFCIYKYFEVQESKTLEKRWQEIKNLGGATNISDDGYNQFIEAKGLWGKIIGNRAMYNQYLKQGIKEGLCALKKSGKVEGYIQSFNKFSDSAKLRIQNISEDHYLDHLAHVNNTKSFSKFLDIFSIIDRSQKFRVSTLNNASSKTETAEAIPLTRKTHKVVESDKKVELQISSPRQQGKRSNTR